MSSAIAEFLRSVRVADSRRSGPLQVFGLRRDASSSFVYTIFDDAAGGGTVEVTEVSEGGSVPTLSVSNRGDTAVFFMAGEHLVGAKQNRVLNASLVVPARSETPIPVTCVEAGRWGYRSRSFRSEGSSSHHVLRAMMSRQVTRAYRRTGRATSDQAEVWNEVQRKLHAMDAVSPTAALQEAYERRAASLDSFSQELPAPAGCHGAVFILGGRIAGLDLFDKQETLAKLWPKILRSYALDALESPADAPDISPDVVRAWIEKAAGANAEAYRSPGLGDDVRVVGDDVVGAGLVVEGQPVHVEMYASTKPAQAEPERTPWLDRDETNRRWRSSSAKEDLETPTFLRERMD